MRLPGLRILISSLPGCKDQVSIQLSTTPDPEYQWESDTHSRTPQARAKRSALSQQVTTRHIKTDAHKGIANARQKKHERSTKEVPPWNGKPHDSTSVLKAFPSKLDIKRHSLIFSIYDHRTQSTTIDQLYHFIFFPLGRGII